ncbi:4-(cytidine 5'-diphospho)-2-C-methyl-D-erythritol kinase [Aliterella atlantica]|uniref:4-diphosphocytidyl-2-C-methyl-D-erythritol kinase n=1 Tax=Aliterella atlantica CENA595 TaxID=1618023 RepID=A0A0D8ZPG6_9CYAN|nr:4-(cytidine 5'-diphospho)-2-C-methyl-D-erythritol kinase [Aliterella atlantica]KJH70389.1 4-diphosphocytidyl-2C-methyl-D-erythritol kinase [Aliterella atlantica CENA595]
MRSYTLTSPAKINLYLEILGDRPDGYHELAMILQTVELADKIDLRSLSTEDIRVRTSNPQLPTDNKNLAYQAAALMAAEFPEAFAQYGGVEINIDKHIPIAAGLAGGSSNAAAVLVGLDLMWKIGLTQSELETLASQLGSDVPFCIAGGTAIATGRGDDLSPLPSPEDIYVVLGKYRHIEVSTAWAYQTYRSQFGSSYVVNKQDLDSRAAAVHSSSMVSAIVHEDKEQIGQKLHNDLEKVVLPNYPQVAQLRQAFQQAGCLGTMMSGSGSTVFALCESQSQAKQVQQQIRTSLTEPNLDLWLTRLCSTGIQVLSSTRD